MLTRCRLLCVRNFKSFSQYHAERLGITEEKLNYLKNERKKGAYDEWKAQTIADGRINFILDHIPPTEQAAFLKEFQTKDLAAYVLNHIRELDEASLKKIAGMQVRYHVWGPVNSALSLTYNGIKVAVLTNEDATKKNRLAKAARLNLQEKLKELAWKLADHEVVRSEEEVAKA